MTYNLTMHATFEAEKNKKAFTYTIIICATLLLLAFIITWPIMVPSQPVVQDLLEINLGNNEEGFGIVQPKIKGQTSPTQEAPVQPKQATTSAKEEPAKDIQPDDNAEKDAAPITKPVKVSPKTIVVAKQPTVQPVKNTSPSTVVAPPAPKPQKPKLTYNGPGSGSGNGATEDNGYRYQGNKPGGKGDAGDPSGKGDSYGNTPGGKSGVPRVISGGRKIIKFYSFTGDLPKAVIYANIKVAPSGTGTFVGFAKNSSTRSQAYATAISNNLRNVQFDKSDNESMVVVQFNFIEN